MYIVQSGACSVPNSRTPVSPAQLQASQQILANMNAKANLAQASMNALNNRTDLNTNGWPLASHGGTPAGGTSAYKPTGLRDWPKRNGQASCIVTTGLPKGLPVQSPVSYSAPTPPPAPSLVTQGHPSSIPVPLCTQYPYGSIPYVDCLAALKNSGMKLVGTQKIVSQQGMGDTGCGSFVEGILAAIGLGAAGLYIYDSLRRTGRIS